MFLKLGVANVWYATLSASYLQNNEREWLGDAESLPARKTFLYVSVNGVNQLSSWFCLVEYTVHHVFDPRSTSCIWVSESVHICSRHHRKRPKRTLLILKDYYSTWKGKVLLNKWKLVTFLNSSDASWTWQWKYYHWFTFFDLVNTYRQMWQFLFILYRPHIYRFPATIVFSGPPTKTMNRGFAVVLLQSSPTKSWCTYIHISNLQAIPINLYFKKLKYLTMLWIFHSLERLLKSNIILIIYYQYFIFRINLCCWYTPASFLNLSLAMLV
jgi:hypothetical protein